MAMPSVSRAAGTPCSIEEKRAIRVGAIAKPARNRVTAMATIEPTNGIGTMTTARRRLPTRTREIEELRHRNVPVIRPASMLPADQQASRTPAYGFACCSDENATVLTSAAANIDPRANETAARTMTGAHGMSGRGPEACRARCGTGWVLRCAASRRVPGTPVTRASPSPAQGCHCVARTVARVGPTTKISSSITDSRAYAVWTSAVRPLSTYDHRARTTDPIGG
jgi:hypothetical protein